jgi:hypothetical protein
MLGVVGGVVSFIGGIVVKVACSSVEASCVPCYSSDDHVCDAVAASHGNSSPSILTLIRANFHNERLIVSAGKACFYNANDFDVLCGDMQRKLLLVGACLSIGFMLSVCLGSI